MDTLPPESQIGSDERPDQERQYREQLQHGRIIEVLIVLGLLALIGLSVWITVR
jgi:hypothetical protein